MVEEASLAGMKVSYVARKYGIAPNLFFQWRKFMNDGGKTAVQADEQVVSSDVHRQPRAQFTD